MTVQPTPTGRLPRYAHRRGTRGFAAFVTVLAGFVVYATARSGQQHHTAPAHR